MADRLFTPRFLVMWAYSFTVFVSIFQLLPAAPYRILELGGSTAAAGLFLGVMTFASALSAPLTGVLGDRLGQRRVLMAVSLVLALCTAGYAIAPGYRVMLAIVVVHGLFWSALLSASGAYMTGTLPASRRAEGFGYWGLASVVAIAAAPSIGFWVFRFGWTALCVELVALNLLMAAIAWRLPDDRAAAVHEPVPAGAGEAAGGSFIEWRVLALSVGMALVSFAYGSLTSFSALFADALGVRPRGLFFLGMASAVLVGRLTLGRALDRIGHRRVLLPSLAAPAAGMALLALATGPASFLTAALVFGSGFGLMYPAYTAYVMGHVAAGRRGAAFGAMLAAFDTGIGLGSSAMGWLIEQGGFRLAFGGGAALAALALPYFLVLERRLGFRA